MTSPLPQPPTENLYKFMAIAGLLLLVATVYFPFVLENKLEDQLSQNYESGGVLTADLEFALAKQVELHSLITNSIAVKNGKYTNSPNKLEIVYSDDEVKKMKDEVDDLGHQAQVSKARFDANIKRAAVLENHLRFIKRVQWFFNFISSILIVFGFRFWYCRIQVYLDRDLKSSSTKPHSSPDSKR